MYDCVIVGAGFAGSVLAERLASQQNQRVLVIEKRRHIGGNCHDYYDEHGILVHQYGPHLFHTSNQAVFSYLSQFTDWLNYHHQVLAVIDGQQVPVPFNLNTMHQLMPESLANALELKLIDRYGYDVKVPILQLREVDDPELKYLADYIYNKMFVNYTSKQWNCKPEDIAPEVTARVPVFISKDNRYFQDCYQAIPRLGYTRIFERMLAHPNISLMLNTDYKSVLDLDPDTQQCSLFGQPYSGRLIYTGLIDELFDYRFGELPYRSLRFQFENHRQAYYQPVTTVNYPNDYDYTRITEFKRISQQITDSTTIVKEFPQDYARQDPERDVPYYPVFTAENQRKFDQYQAYSQQFEQITLVGRLAEYRYYDMDDIVARALAVYAELAIG